MQLTAADGGVAGQVEVSARGGDRRGERRDGDEQVLLGEVPFRTQRPTVHVRLPIVARGVIARLYRGEAGQG